MTEPVYFASAAEWRAWLEQNHASATEIMLGLAKAKSGLPYVTYPEALDEALCFGWIDGVRRSIDDRRWMIRFTPRKKRSNWSDVNIRHVARLTAAGRMAPPGIAAFEGRDGGKTGSYSFENHDAAFAPEEEAEFRASDAAWAWFAGRPKTYRHAAVWWVVSAKTAATRRKRLDTLIADSAAGVKVKPLRQPGEA